MTTHHVAELRLCVTTDDRAGAVAFFRDVLGMPELATWTHEDSAVTLLEAGRATIELADPDYAEHIDAVEVGRRVAGPIRVALAVDDVVGATDDAVANGAGLIAPPTVTPWASRNSRLAGPAGLQLTLFADA